MTRLLLLVFLLTIAPTLAQDPPTATIRVLCFERDPSGLSKLSVVTPEKKFEEILFPESFPSRPVKVPLIEGKVFFYNPSKTEGSPVANAIIPRGMKEAFVMFFPAPETEDGPLYSTVVLNADTDSIPKGGALVMNISPEDLRVIIGEHRLLLKAGKTAAVRRPTKRNDYNMASMIFMRMESDEWKVQAETAVRFPGTQQQFFVAFPDPNRNRIKIRAYDLSPY